MFRIHDLSNIQIGKNGSIIDVLIPHDLLLRYTSSIVTLLNSLLLNKFHLISGQNNILKH